MKKVALILSVLVVIFFVTKAKAQTQNIQIQTDASLCGMVEVLLYAIDVSNCPGGTIYESNWLSFMPGTTRIISINSAIWPRGFTVTPTTRIEAVAVQTCRTTGTFAPRSCLNAGFVKVGNAASRCAGFSTLFARDCFEDPGTCSTCTPGSVFNVSYNHATPTDLYIDIN